MTNWPQEYLAQIRAGKEAVSKKVRAVYERECAWMEAPPAEGFPWHFDAGRGQHYIDFIELFCKTSKGKLGQAIQLDLFQKAKLQLIFGWVDDKGLRRIKEVIDLRGRKCGKSTETAAVEWAVELLDGEGSPEVYCCANKLDQAKIIFNEVAAMRRQSPALLAISKKRQSDIYVPSNFGIIKALASDTKTMDGLNAHFFSLDEFHEAKTRALYDVMKQSQSAREQPLAWLISTNGFVREGFFDDVYTEAAGIATWEEGFRDYRVLPLIYELDAREEWQDPKAWAKANPGLGKIKSIKALQENVEKAKRNSSFLPTVLTKDFNLPENSSATWLPYEIAVNEETADMDYLRGSYAIGGCDLSATTDLTCATLLIRKPSDPRFYVLQQYFLPESRVKEVERTSAREAPYKLWAEKGWLTICEGAAVDYHAVTSWFAQRVTEDNIRPLWIGYDAALSGYWAPEMQEYGFDMERIRQGPFTWSYSMKQLEGALKDRLVVYQNNPILRWCLLNTAKKTANKDGIETIQPVKSASNRRIDGMVSLLNAWVCYNNHVDDFLRYVK